MNALKKLLTGAATAAFLVASVGVAAPANAAEQQSAKDTPLTMFRTAWSPAPKTPKA